MSPKKKHHKGKEKKREIIQSDVDGNYYIPDDLLKNQFKEFKNTDGFSNSTKPKHFKEYLEKVFDVKFKGAEMKKKIHEVFNNDVSGALGEIIGRSPHGLEGPLYMPTEQSEKEEKSPSKILKKNKQPNDSSDSDSDCNEEDNRHKKDLLDFSRHVQEKIIVKKSNKDAKNKDNKDDLPVYKILETLKKKDTNEMKKLKSESQKSKKGQSSSSSSSSESSSETLKKKDTKEMKKLKSESQKSKKGQSSSSSSSSESSSDDSDESDSNTGRTDDSSSSSDTSSDNTESKMNRKRKKIYSSSSDSSSSDSSSSDTMKKKENKKKGKRDSSSSSDSSSDGLETKHINKNKPSYSSSYDDSSNESDDEKEREDTNDPTFSLSKSHSAKPEILNPTTKKLMRNTNRNKKHDSHISGQEKKIKDESSKSSQNSQKKAKTYVEETATKSRDKFVDEDMPFLMRAYIRYFKFRQGITESEIKISDDQDIIYLRKGRTANQVYLKLYNFKKSKYYKENSEEANKDNTLEEEIHANTDFDDVDSLLKSSENSNNNVRKIDNNNQNEFVDTKEHTLTADNKPKSPENIHKEEYLERKQSSEIASDSDIDRTKKMLIKELKEYEEKTKKIQDKIMKLDLIKKDKEKEENQVASSSKKSKSLSPVKKHITKDKDAKEKNENKTDQKLKKKKKKMKKEEVKEDNTNEKKDKKNPETYSDTETTNKRKKSKKKKEKKKKDTNKKLRTDDDTEYMDNNPDNENMEVTTEDFIPIDAKNFKIMKCDVKVRDILHENYKATTIAEKLYTETYKKNSEKNRTKNLQNEYTKRSNYNPNVISNPELMEKIQKMSENLELQKNDSESAFHNECSTKLLHINSKPSNHANSYYGTYNICSYTTKNHREYSNKKKETDSYDTDQSQLCKKTKLKDSYTTDISNNLTELKNSEKKKDGKTKFHDSNDIKSINIDFKKLQKRREEEKRLGITENENESDTNNNV